LSLAITRRRAQRGAMSRGVRLVRAVPVVLAVALVAAFTYAAVEGSDRMVNQRKRSADCRTPAHLGLAYEAINYDRATDARLTQEPDPLECIGPTDVDLGDDLVTVDDVRLAGWYVPAAGGSSDQPTVVIAHGWTANKSGGLDVLRLVNDRYNAVLFDFRNHGQSQDSQTTQGINEQRDIVAVLDWLTEHEGPDQIVLWGQSMGGHAAVNVAVDDDRVDAVVLDSLHPRLIVPYALRSESEGYPLGRVIAFAGMIGGWVRTGVNVWSDEPIDAIDDLGDRPVLLVHGSEDSTIPLEEAVSLLEAARAGGVDAHLETCAADHAQPAWKCAEEYRGWLSGFLDEALAPSPP
jgi:pimeloyl-ACP methyl ester carboxylesterase